MSFEEETQVYNYVKDKSNKYLPTILRAITDGVVEENERLREQKSHVESGLVVLLDKVKINKIDKRFKSVLIQALDSCTFFKFDSFRRILTESKKGGKLNV